ncbi:MAG: hypothetical protein IIX84_03755, partial [Oscillospiraceae bacterium]|nr:hypothetical protein [Oscillospiraceae bacterium]
MKRVFHALRSLKYLFIVLLVLVDTSLLLLSSVVSYNILGNFFGHNLELAQSVALVAIEALLCLVGIALFRSYKVVLKFARAANLMRVVCGELLGTALSMLLFPLVGIDLPFYYYTLFFLLSTFSLCFVRMLCNFTINRIKRARKGPGSIPALIVGAGYTGTHLLQEIVHSPNNNYTPIGFVDDNPHLEGQTIDGIQILGPTLVIPQICKKYNVKVIFF